MLRNCHRRAKAHMGGISLTHLKSHEASAASLIATRLLRRAFEVISDVRSAWFVRFGHGPRPPRRHTGIYLSTPP